MTRFIFLTASVGIFVGVEACGHSRLVRAPAARPETGTVDGRVLWNEQPLAGARVTVTSEYNFSSTHYGEGTTDARGHFSISGIPPGQKYLYVSGNGRVYWVAAVTPFVMSATMPTTAPDTYVCKGFDPQSPKKDETLDTARSVLRWDPYPGAVDYAVRVLRTAERNFVFQRGDRDARIRATSVQVDVDLPPGEYTWRVDAFNAAGHIIGCSYYPRRFSVTANHVSRSGASLHGEVGDPIGDAVPDARVRTPADLVRATVNVLDGHLSVAVRFAPGVFDPVTMLVIVNLDTDRNTATGQPVVGLGVDYVISMGDGQNDQARIGRYVGGPEIFSPVGNVPVTFLPDGMDVTVPLSLLGNSEGRLNFRVVSFSHVPDTQTTGAIDTMPDIGLPPGRVQ
jgi:hypothetical protein